MELEKRKQLYVCARPDFEVAEAYTPSFGLTMRSGGTLPLYRWPDKHWCLEVNMFLQALLLKGYSHRFRGGTLGTYSAYLSELVRFCYVFREKNFLSLTDGDFTRCIRKLEDAKRVRNGTLVAANDRTTVRNIGAVWLEFLSFIGEFYADSAFVGPDGRIRAAKLLASRGPGRWPVYSWTHISFGEYDPYRRRLPLSESVLKRLRAVVGGISRSEFVRRRRLVMLELFDVVGLRRAEASLLRVGEVAVAIGAYRKWTQSLSAATGEASPAFFLEFRMVKQKDGAQERTRKVPISAVTLQFFDEYLNRRGKLLRKLGRTAVKPSDPFFINMRDGTEVQPNFFTLEFYMLAQAARVEGPCSPHMARGRYITREFLRLLQAHHMETKDEFRKALINVKAFKEKVREITGHANAESLDVYINLAVDELVNLKATVSRVQAQMNADALRSAHAFYEASISAGVDAAAAGAELARTVAAFTRTA